MLVVGGSRGMAGAPCLAARAAYRSGAGLVQVAVPDSIAEIVATKLDECLVAPLPDKLPGTLSKEALAPLKNLCLWADVVVLGPGLSQNEDTQHVIREFATTGESPLVLDADGLNAFQVPLTIRLTEVARQRPLVITPHPGEASRLLGQSIAEIQADRLAAAEALAEATGAVVVLKGAGTIVRSKSRQFVNSTGNSGMATGGTGDVLAGMIGALLAQGLNAFDAASLGVYLHGLAGDYVAGRNGVWGLIASDLIDALPRTFVAYDSQTLHPKAM